MKRKKAAAYLVLLCSLLVLPTARAEIDPGIAMALVQKAHVAAGLSSIAPQLKSALVLQARQGTGARGPKLSEQELAGLMAAVDRAYSTERLLLLVTEGVASRTQQPDLAAINQWFATTSSRAIEAAEQRALADDRPQQQQMTDAVVALRQASDQRRTLLKELIRMTRAVDVVSDLSAGTAAAVISGLSSATPGAQPVSIEEAKRNLHRIPTQRENIERAAIVTSAKTYASVSDADLADFVSFLKTPQGQRFYDVMVTAFSDALNVAGVELGRQMARVGRKWGQQ